MKRNIKEIIAKWLSGTKMSNSKIEGWLNIVDVINRHTKLVPEGKNLIGVCPFCEQEKFSVSNDYQVFYCFGCKASGNKRMYREKMTRLRKKQMKIQK